MTQTVLITGASSGIGKAFAYLYAKDGYDVLLVSRSEKDLKLLKKDLEGRHSMHAFVFAIDLSKFGSAETLYHKIATAGRKVDILINNAGFGGFGEIVEQSPKQASDMIHLNATTLTELCILFGNDMKRRKSGGIINIGSTASFQPVPYFATYSATKAYVLSFTEALSKELEDYNVRVTCLCPGATRTLFFSTAGKPDYGKERSMMTPEEVALIGKRALESGTMTVIPGAFNAIRAGMVRFFPRWMVASIAKRLFKIA